jgi:membrane associated rhomboid family serine protease
MKTRHLYLALAVLGVLLPNAPFFRWVMDHGLDARQFVTDLFANGVSSFFGLDVVLSALVVCAFVLSEGRRLGLKRLWMPIAALFLVGVSLGLPLFLYQRQRRLDHASAA